MNISEQNKREQLAEELYNKSEIVFDTQKHTVHLQESSNEFDISVYPLGTKYDEDMKFDEDLFIDGGIVQNGDCLDAVNYAFDF